MVSYYNEVIGNLFPGDIAKSEDINHIQTNIKDALKALLNDHHELNSYILGGRENDFVLTPSKKTLGRYLDTYSIPTDSNLKALSLRQYSYRQPIAKTKSTLYSIVVKMGNNTKYDVPVKCSIEDITGRTLGSNVVTLAANNDKVEYEFLFDLKDNPTSFGLDMDKLKEEDGKHVPPRTDEGSYRGGVDHSRERDIKNFSMGVNQLFIVIDAIGTQISNDENGELIEELNDDSFVIYVDNNGEYGGQFDCYLEQGQATAFTKTKYSLYFKDVYATDINYSCTGGEAIIAGEKVICTDSHVTISGSHKYGNVLALVYMDADGHLRSANSKASIGKTSTNIEDWEMEDILPPDYLLIAKVLVYTDVNKEPLIIQDDTNQETRPRSHHERLRRLEKELDYNTDISIPPRLKYTMTGDDWVDKDGDASLLSSIYNDGAQEGDADKSNYFLTMDAEGHLVVKTTDSEVTTAPVTFKNDEKTTDTTRIIPTEIQPDEEKTIETATTTTSGGTTSSVDIEVDKSSGLSKSEAQAMINEVKEKLKSGALTFNEAKNKYAKLKFSNDETKNNTPQTSTTKTETTKEIIIKTSIDSNITKDQTDSIFKDYEEDDLRRLNRISEMTNILLESKTGTITLKNQANKNILATTDEEAKETKFNPWDDDAANRPANKEVTPTSREYTVTSGKNGKNDWESEFPAMTFYTKTSYNLTGLTIPIVKFQNCSGIKFFIWKRQGPNNKTNTVWFEKEIYRSKTFSLENARTDDKYQYMDDGFTIEFEDKGLDLPEGQYVIVCLPIPKEGKGSCWVDTYKPENSKDFCIRYYGAANASHFLLKDRYQEIWYNSATATGTKKSYEKEGSFISGTITLKEDVAPIAKVKTSVGKTEIPEGCSIEIYGDTGSGFQKLNTDNEGIDEDKGNETVMKGNRTTFRWKAVLKGNEENTPKLEYDDEKKYALQFTLIHEAPATGDSSAALEFDKNMCITSKPFDGDSILKEYLGDDVFDREDNRFSNFEFARIWADKINNPNLVIDISGADLTEEVKDKNNKTHKFSAYSLHYADLTLDDFSHTSVDYSNYDTNLEKDEHNMRLKLDTENSYNDNDIQLFNINDFEIIEDESNSIKFDDNAFCTIPKNYQSEENQLLYRLKLKNPIDLTKYTGIKVGFTVKKGSVADKTFKGLGVYLSSQYEATVPSNEFNEPSGVLVGSEALLESISKKTTYESVLGQYKDKIIKISDGATDGLKASPTQYFRYIGQYDSSTQSLVYNLTLLHDIKNFYIYDIGKITPSVDEDMSFYQEIEIDQESTNLKYVQEIGIILLCGEKDGNDDDKVSIEDNFTFKINEFKAIENDYYPVFNPKEHHMTLYDPSFTKMTNPYTIRKNGEIEITATTYGPLGMQGTVPKTFSPDVMQIHMIVDNLSSAGQTICFFRNRFATHKYKHIGIQIASDVYIPKYALQLNLCSDTEGKKVIESVDIPTLNYIYIPNKVGTINLSQVFKKIENLDVDVKSLSISTTPKFKYFLQQTLGKDKKHVNIFIGKIVMYKARTIPMFHKKMRFKFYDKNFSDNIGGYESGKIYLDPHIDDTSTIMIRKIGAVLDYR